MTLIIFCHREHPSTLLRAGRGHREFWLSFVFSDKGILVPKGLRYPSAILPGLDDYYRTRLTHSIEVAQIGRTIAKGLRLNESLAEAICLAHDLGHSPFGHAGEKVLNDLMTESGGFEQNLPEL